ncbi:hypothetical protein [Carboxylicivirga sp. RSCT41]|uniref:hypothetical protein n=1 Tax=Carboxylicivirga agarovorans TaxID=3417570 RepID=UPI003D32FD62
MFGLEDISHWQFARGLLVCLAGYYIIILMYLALKKAAKPEETSFEAEALQHMEKAPVQTVRASDFPDNRINQATADDKALRVATNHEPDYSGYVMETLQGRPMEEKEAFLNNIEYQLQEGDKQ